jgi:hypothetical protein
MGAKQIVRGKKISFLKDGYMSSIIGGLKRKTNATNDSTPTCNVFRQHLPLHVSINASI